MLLGEAAAYYPGVVHRIHGERAFATVICRFSNLANGHGHPEPRWIARLFCVIDFSVGLK